MKRLLYWLYLLVKRQLKNPVIVVVLIAMPVAALIITNTASLKEKGSFDSWRIHCFHTGDCGACVCGSFIYKLYILSS